MHGDGQPRVHLFRRCERFVGRYMIGLHEPARFIRAYSQQSIIRRSEQLGNLTEMSRISRIAAIIYRNSITLKHKRSPKSLPSVAHRTLAPMLGGQKSD